MARAASDKQSTGVFQQHHLVGPAVFVTKVQEILGQV